MVVLQGIKFKQFDFNNIFLSINVFYKEIHFLGWQILYGSEKYCRVASIF